jgi:hypothetical protein
MESCKYAINFMRTDSLQIYGLQDWSKAKWDEELRIKSCMVRILLSKLDIRCDTGDHADLVRSRLMTPLTLQQWEEILIFQNFCVNRKHCVDMKIKTRYPHASLISYSIFQRDFPRGVDNIYLRNTEFAVKNSGHVTVYNDERCSIAILAYAWLATGCVAVFAYLTVLYNREELWSLDATIQNWNVSNVTHVINTRTRERGTFASLTNSLCFSLCINSSLDKFAKIDPSTSTVLVGILLGNTWGFVLDSMFGSDEGLREYLFSPREGISYALGSLATWRFARYMITVVFDTFVSVILFHRLFPPLVNMGVFQSREWMANAIVSAIISVSTFQVYANMTRFQWAYPSGHEDISNPWISGSTMILVTVVANMVFLSTETRIRYGESGINTPHNKVAVTILTFLGLSLMQLFDASDAKSDLPNSSPGTNVHCPLKGVVSTQKNVVVGGMVLVSVCCVCFGYTIFGTSKLPICRTKIAVMCVYMTLMLVLVGFFTFVPLFSSSIVRDLTNCSLTF